jgi:Peroxisomal biogenesis factor 11 (PEX11)
LIAGLNANNPDLAGKFAIFSTKMSQTRATLRLFDDLPMLAYTLEYGMGKKVMIKLLVYRELFFYQSACFVKKTPDQILRFNRHFQSCFCFQ